MKARSRSTVASLYAALLLALSPGAHGQTLPPEVQVGTKVVIDFEFDWGRDGNYCPTCNYGAGNNRLAYIDSSGNVWVGHVDATTGDFVPTNGKETLVDIDGVPSQAIGNGPEWLASRLASGLVYTRQLEGSGGHKCVGVAHVDTDGVWQGGCMSRTNGASLPLGTDIVGDYFPMVSFQNSSHPGFNVFWRLLSDGSAAHQVFTDSRAPPSRRWIPGTHDMVLVAAAPPDDSGHVYRQVFLYSTEDDTLQQLTFGASDKNAPFMWQAPEFDGELVLLAVPGNSREADIYRYLLNPDGSSSWKIIKRIHGTPDYPYVASPEPFVYQGKSWVFFEIAAAPRQLGDFAPSQIAISGIEPDVPSFRVLTEDVGPDLHTRRDPEYYITANGPYLYYNRYILPAGGGATQTEGVFRVDVGLGPPQAHATYPAMQARH